MKSSRGVFGLGEVVDSTVAIDPRRRSREKKKKKMEDVCASCMAAAERLEVSCMVNW